MFFFHPFHLLFLLAGLFLYFLPAYLGRHKPNFTAIFLVNLLAGWTFIGWIIALVWALSAEPQPAPGSSPQPAASSSQPAAAPPRPAASPPQNAAGPKFFCSSCGKPFTPGARFCSSCGAALAMR